MKFWIALQGIFKNLPKRSLGTSLEQIAKPDTFRELLELITCNGGPENLDLSNWEAPGIDLGLQAIRGYLKQGKPRNSAWFSSATHGINLRGVYLYRAKLPRATLTQADLREAALNHTDLRMADLHDAKLTDGFLIYADAAQADFSYCDLRDAYLIGANFVGANLSRAQLQGADLSAANLEGAILWDAKLLGTNLSQANLCNTNLYGAWLNGTYLTRHQIGQKIIQELTTYETPDQKIRDKDNPCDPVIPGRHMQATEIYRALKNNFLSIGSYDDASWAYVKERKMRKCTHWPPKRVRQSYPHPIAALASKGLRSKWQHFRFYLKHFLSWVADWVFEVTSGYGERPLLTLWWAFGFVLFFAFLFRAMDALNTSSLIDYFNYSLATFVTFGFSGLEVSGSSAQTLSSLEALLGICLLALLMFALGNRINRS